MSHPLDNPILASLETRHAPFALAAGQARRFVPEIGPLAGLRGPLRAGLEALYSLTAPGDGVGVFLHQAPEPAGPWTLAQTGELMQMVLEGPPPPAPERPVLDLGEADAPEMLALAQLTKPGPFAARTHELGAFVGVREGGRLAAMAGERLKLPGFTEISAVCTHPAHLGRGHAAALMSVVARRVVARGETPFLHVLPHNARAVALYERLGFRKRLSFRYAILRRA